MDRYRQPADDDLFASVEDSAALSALYDSSADDAPEGYSPEDGAEGTSDLHDDAYGDADSEAPMSSPDGRAATRQPQDRKLDADPRYSKLQKERDDLQRARAGAQRRAADLERQLAQLAQEREQERLQAAELVLRERIRTLPADEQQAALAQFQQAVQTHYSQQQAQQAQVEKAQLERLTFAQTIEREFGLDPQTGQPLVTADALMANAGSFQTGEQMLRFAAQQAGLLDAYGNPTAKLAQLQRLQQQGATPAPARQPAPDPARQRRAQRGKDNFANPRPVSQPPPEPKSLDDAVELFIQRATQGRRR